MGKKGPCFHCGIKSTPLWRRGPPEKPVLCNACGSRYRLMGSLNGYVPKHLHQLHHLGNLTNVYCSRSRSSKNRTISHSVPDASTGANNNSISDCITSTEDENGKAPNLWSFPIPVKKRSTMHDRNRAKMQKFHGELLNLWRDDKVENETSPEEILMHNVNSFIPNNEIGLGGILLEPDVPSTKKKKKEVNELIFKG